MTLKKSWLVQRKPRNGTGSCVNSSARKKKMTLSIRGIDLHLQ
jgi:hypothetical protein